MEEYHTVKMLLDSLFGNGNLTSWTLHENGQGTNVTLRFGSDMAQNSNTKTTYKRKSTTQINRDQKRMDKYNEERGPNTRSRTIEQIRSGDNESFSLGATGFSDLSGIHSISNSDPGELFPLSAHTPSAYSPEHVLISTPLPPEHENASPVQLPAADCSYMDMPINHQPPQSTNPRNITLPYAARHFTADESLILNHMSEKPYTKFDCIRCHKCDIELRSTGVRPGKVRLSYCDRCDIYICSNRSRPPYCSGQDDHKLLCQNPIHFVT